jgi:aryl-alcohol dehydrogenase-like predicted oxidoreductase
MTVIHRPLGRSGLSIAPLVFGGNVFGWTADEAMSHRLLDGFVDAGFNMIDTADVYSRWVPGNEGGESEAIIGRWLAKSGKRERVLIATKVGHDMGPRGKGLSKAHILKSVDQSLARLQTDRIDLYQSHVEDAETPTEETLGAYEQLVREGKVRAIGASNHSVEKMTEALAISERNGWPRYETLQPLYNLIDRSPFEDALAPFCRERELSVICFFPLASGFLTGSYRKESDAEGRARGERAKKYMNERGWRVLAAVDEVARENNANPAQVALAWLLTRPGVTPIASARTLEQLQDLLAAPGLGLAPDAIARLDKASA